jgi:nucleotide-binding universal stress UspA family protein
VSTILIGVDSTARSEDAVALGRRLARAGTPKVIVATVTSPLHPNRDESHLIVRRMSGLLAGVDPERIHTAVVAAATPAQGLHQLAETEAADLVVVGSTHTGHLGRVRPGSTGERLLYGSPCAVAVAPHGYRTRGDLPVARVGVAWDGSPESQTALAAAIGAARAFGARLELTTVFDTHNLSAPAMMGAPSYASVRRDAEEALQRYLDEAVRGSATLVESVGVMLEGRSWRELATRSEQLDLLFAGSRGYGPLHAVLVGGTSGPLMQHAHCPVVVLPRDTEPPVVEVFESGSAAVS